MLFRSNKKIEEAQNHSAELEKELRVREKEAIALRKKLNEHEQKLKLQEVTYSNKNEYEKSTNELKKLKTRENILTIQVNQLKVLVENLEGANNELVGYIRSLPTRKVEPANVSENEVELLRNELISKSNELNMVKIGINKLNDEMIYLKSELGAKSIQCEEAMQTITKLSDDLSQAHTKLAQQNTDEDVINRQILEKEDEIIKFRTALAKTSEELEETKQAFFYKSKEVEDLQSQLHELTSENQNVNEEITRLGQSQNDLKQLTEELQNKHIEAYQNLQLVEDERDNILNTYKMVCDSNERQRMDVEAVINENKILREKIIQDGKEMDEEKLKEKNLEKRNSEFMNEMKNQVKQIKQLAKELQDSQSVIIPAETVKQTLLERADKAEKERDELKREIARLNSGNIYIKFSCWCYLFDGHSCEELPFEPLTVAESGMIIPDHSAVPPLR